jgi:ribosomal protein S18 acetylase RimI-like enzyme
MNLKDYLRKPLAEAATTYPIADAGDWYGDLQYRQDGARLVMMSPDEYLSRVRPLKLDDASEDNINDLMQHIQSGRTLDPLKIYADGREDGRHRAYAAQRLNIAQVPVIVWPKKQQTEAKSSGEVAYELELIRGRDEDVLKVTSNKTDKWIEIRGKPHYETHGHDENDPLHKFLDKLDPATVAALMAGDVKFLNPNNSRTTPSIDQTRAAWNEPSMAEAISSINVGKDEKFGIKFDVIRRSGKVIGRMGELEVLQTPDIGFVNDRVAPGFIVWDPVKKKTAGVLMAKRGRSAENIHARTVAISVTAVNSAYEGQGLMLKLYVLLIRKGFALLSDDQQTPGGQKIWARLAKVPGVTVYAVDMTAPEGQQYSAVDPDDITDANFMVYDDDVETLQTLEKERKKLYADKFELVDEMNLEQEKVDNDEIDASPTKVRELDDRIKVIEREISAITKEIKPWLRHKETGLGAKLMAVKTKTATTESTQLTELFNQPYAWHWELEGKNAAIAKFDTADEGVISVFFQSVSPNSPNFETGFKKGISIKRSGEGDQFRIMTTVTKIIEEFMAKNPHVLSLSFVAKREGAAADDPKIRDSRAVLYQRMIQKFAEKHGYEFASAKVGRMTEFMIRRRETAPVAETAEIEIRKPHPKDTLGVKRQDMPQVHRDHYPELLKYLSSHGGQIRHGEVHAHELKAVQSEFSDTGVRKMMSTGGRPSDSVDKKPLIVSSDNYIIDGHHRWLAAWNQDEVVPIMQVSLPVRKLLQLIRDFPHTTYKDIHEERTPLEQACLEGGHAYEAPLDEIKTIAPLKNDDANFERVAAKLKMVADGKYTKIRDVGDNTIYMSNDLASSGDDGYVMITNRDVTEMIGYLQMRAMGRYVEVPKSYKAAMAWVNPKYRRQGVASAMYDTVLDRGYSLVADADQTKDSQKVWTKLVSRHGGYLLADGNIMSGMNDRAWALAYKKNAPYNYTILITGKGVTVKENISVTGTARHKQEQQKKLVPGSEAWFKHWFSLPYLKREDVDRLKEEIVNHIKTHKGVRHEKKVRNG